MLPCNADPHAGHCFFAPFVWMYCSPYQHHFKLVSEAMQALSWVVYTGPNCGAH